MGAWSLPQIKPFVWFILILSSQNHPQLSHGELVFHLHRKGRHSGNECPSLAILSLYGRRERKTYHAYFSPGGEAHVCGQPTHRAFPTGPSSVPMTQEYEPFLSPLFPTLTVLPGITTQLDPSPV